MTNLASLSCEPSLELDPDSPHPPFLAELYCYVLTCTLQKGGVSVLISASVSSPQSMPPPHNHCLHPTYLVAVPASVGAGVEEELLAVFFSVTLKCRGDRAACHLQQNHPNC